jgi:hypothetical protein
MSLTAAAHLGTERNPLDYYQPDEPWLRRRHHHRLRTWSRALHRWQAGQACAHCGEPFTRPAPTLATAGAPAGKPPTAQGDSHDICASDQQNAGFADASNSSTFR